MAAGLRAVMALPYRPETNFALAALVASIQAQVQAAEAVCAKPSSCSAGITFMRGWMVPVTRRQSRMALRRLG
jgi:hypothetical protein